MRKSGSHEYRLGWTMERERTSGFGLDYLWQQVIFEAANGSNEKEET